MNELTETLLKSFPARLAVVVYAADEGWKDVYLESHEIDKQGRILEGKPLKQQTIAGIVDVFFNERQDTVQVSGLLPGNLLKFDLFPGGKYKMVWHHPAERRHLYFSASLHIKSGEAWVPPMIYVANGKTLSVFALGSDDRPAEATPLFLAPFHNVGAGGEVCLGSAQVKKPSVKTYASLMKYWEDLFWLSEFSHLAGADSKTKTNVNVLWNRLIKDKKLTWAQLDELKEIKGRKLKNLL